MPDQGVFVPYGPTHWGALTAYTGSMLVYRCWPGNFDVHLSLPVHLSDLAWMVAVVALWTRARWAIALTYFWGLTLNPQAILTPALDSPDFPHIDFIDLWVQHILVLWAALYVIWGRGGRVDWRDYRLALTVTVGWALMTWPWTRRRSAVEIVSDHTDR